MSQLKLPEFAIERIKNRELEKSIPEFYELEEVIENNDWHNNESVFNHTLTVIEKLNQLLEDNKDKFSNYLNQKITNHTRKELLFLATFLHDIAKKETLIKENRKTTCSNHEEEGAIKANKILSRFDLSEEEKNLVNQIIKYHNVIHPILKFDNDKLNEEFNKIRKNYSNIFQELFLLAIADTLGSQLGKNKPDEFNFRINFYKEILNGY